MRPRTYTCSVNSSLGDAAAIMAEHACGILPIVEDDTHRLLGVITDRDIGLSARAHDRPLDLIPVRSAFSWRLVTCKETDDVLQVCRTMSETGLRRIPITNRRGVLLGLISIDDIAQVACQAADDEAAVMRDAVTRTLAAIGHRICDQQGAGSTAIVAVES